MSLAVYLLSPFNALSLNAVEEKNRGAQVEKVALSQFIKAIYTCTSSGKQMRFRRLWMHLEVSGASQSSNMSQLGVERCGSVSVLSADTFQP